MFFLLTNRLILLTGYIMSIQEHSTFTFMPIKQPSNLNIVLPLQDTQYTFKPLFQWRHLFFMNFCVSVGHELKYC